jgi:hypothetical protein
MIYFITKGQFENRLGAKKVKRIYDDNSDGTADTDAINQLRADASSKVRSYLDAMGIMAKLEPLFDQTTGELLAGKTVPEEVVRLTLDVGVALAAQRHPEVMRQDWIALMKQCESDLCKLRDGKTSLGGGTQGGVETPETSIHGSTVIIGDPDAVSSNDDDSTEGRWSDMGDFS